MLTFENVFIKDIDSYAFDLFDECFNTWTVVQTSFENKQAADRV